MSFSKSGSVITQAAGTTDLDLSGLASITGVTVFNSGATGQNISLVAPL